MYDPKPAAEVTIPDVDVRSMLGRAGLEGVEKSPSSLTQH
jgi:hypothetical protein